MSECPDDLYFAQSHEWARLNEDGSVTIGVSEHAQSELGDVVFVETPQLDTQVAAGDPVAVVESVKAASDIYTPVGGTIIDANTALSDEPELVNSAPYAEGWLFVIRPDDPDELEELLDAKSYQELIEDE